MNVPAFHELTADTPDRDALDASYATLQSRIGAATDDEAIAGAIGDWDALRRQFATWHALVDLRFRQDTGNDDHRRARDEADELHAHVEGLDADIKRALLGSPHRDALEARFGRTAFALWDDDARCFDRSIEADLIAENRLSAEYTELLSGARLEVEGTTYNLSSIDALSQGPDRELRHKAQRAYWGFFQEHRHRIDRIFGDMVSLRTRIARSLGDDDFVALGYRRMHRIDYDRHDVERFRAEVLEHVVPLAADLRAQQARRYGVDPLTYHDEVVYDPAGDPAPDGGHDWMVNQASTMFGRMEGELGEFYEMMRSGDLLDLKSRDGKSPGGFCTAFPSVGLPYIFANFNGTKHDVTVFTHEAGHAYQCWQSRNLQLLDYLWPTYESCEIHSMGLEFLTWPHMELFFGDDAERFRTTHLAGSLLFLPYGVSIDAFQHRVYERPDATSAERAAMWQDVEQRYMPWRNYGDLEHPASGRFWHRQGHVFGAPFYYIDYTLALTVALQLWQLAEHDRADAIARYEALCARGGELSFRALVESVDLIPPFEPGCLRDVVAAARVRLGVPAS